MKKVIIASPNNLSLKYLKWAYHALTIIVLLFLLANYFLKNEKIAYVDSVKILNEYKGSEEAKKAYQVKAQVWRANIDTLTNGVKSAIQAYEKSMATMSKKEQDLSKQLIDTKQKQLADYQKGIQASAKQEDGKLTQNIVAQIDAYILKYGKTHNYKLILIANQSGTIAYARDGLDITSDVIEGLNADFISLKK